MRITRNILYQNKIWWMLAVWLCLPAPAALSKNDDNVPTTHGEVIRDYARLTFEWPEPVYFNANAQGNELTIAFDHPANPNLGALLKQMHPYITHAERQSDGKTILLTLDQPYRIRTFVSGTVSGIDLLDVATKNHPRSAKTAKAAPPPPPPQKPEPEVAEAAPAETPEPPAAEAVKESQPAETKESEAEASPVAPLAEPPAPPVQKKEPAKKKPEPPKKIAKASSANPFAKLSPSAGKAKKSLLEQKREQAQEPKPATPAAVPSKEGEVVQEETQATDALAAPDKAAPVSSTPGKVKVGVSAAEDAATLRFPFTERTAAAVFIRTHTLWVVFNKPVVLDLSDFDEMAHTVVSKPVLLPSNKGVILTMPIDDNVYATMAREPNSYEWALLLTSTHKPLAKVLPLSVDTQPPTPAHVFIPVEEMGDPLTVTDPQIGDQLVIMPVYETAVGIAPLREFVDFNLLDTSQGIAVVKKSDGVAVTELRNGLRISMPRGATLTPELPDLPPEQSADNLQSSTTLFPYEEWKFEGTPMEERKQKHMLFHRIVESSTIDGANDARLKLAQLYLSEGMSPEAIALLDGIKRTNPSFYHSAKLNAMRGAANFLMYRFAEGARDFAASELNNNKEVEYWRSMLSDLLGNPGQNYDYLGLNQDYISKYPPIFRQRLAVVAADRMVDAKQYNSALKVFDTLHEAKLLDPIKNYVDFLLAKISSETGQQEEADKTLEKLAQDYSHPFVRSRAEFTLIAEGLGKGTLPKDQAIDKLERLRLGWHGDNLELSELTVLGELYSEKKDYVNAMRVWQDAILSFPNTAAAIDMGHKMQDAFVNLFNEGGADNLPPMDALAIYYEYRTNTPSGDVGNEMINHLVDRLVAVDLLEQAAVLLDHEMHFQLEKEQRSEVGARLATIYLLNHQPEKALQALQDSVYGQNPTALHMLRNRLSASAMSDLDKPDKAIETLGQDQTPDAERIRLDVYWKEKDWPRVVSGIENMLKTRPDITAPISLDESEYLLKLALAYRFQKDAVQLQYLHDYFGPLMKENPNKPVFDFLTGNDISLTPTNFDEIVKNLTDTRSFLDNYRARIKTESLSKVTKDKK